MYQPIQPFPEAPVMEFPELKALCSVWLEKKSELTSDGVYAEFVKRMQREWAIETGIIERLYTWDRGVTEILIEQGLDASIIAHRAGFSAEDAWHVNEVIQDHLTIVDGLFGFISTDVPLTEHFIRTLHAQFTAHQECTQALTPDGHLVQIQLVRGAYKTLPNNPRRPDGSMHEYCPPDFTVDEMQRLVAMFEVDGPRYSTEVRAAWLHHRFTHIHPFQDGNGRVARALASLVFLKEGLFPLVIRDSDRSTYIDALEVADQGDLAPLVQLFASRQRESVLKAIGLEQQVQQSYHPTEIIASAVQILKAKHSAEMAKVGVVFEYADKLHSMAVERARQVAFDLNRLIAPETPPGRDTAYLARANYSANDGERRHYFHKEIVSIASKFGYFANFEHQRSWVRISIATEQPFDFVLSFHGYGYGDTGVLAVSAFTYTKIPNEEGGNESINLQPAMTDLFQFNHIEPYQSIESRFIEWLDCSYSIALAEWKRTL